jgi:hypothetical protein
VYELKFGLSLVLSSTLEKKNIWEKLGMKTSAWFMITMVF